MFLTLKLSSNLNELLYLIKSLIPHAYVEYSNVHVKAVCVFVHVCSQCVLPRFSHLSVK